MAGSQLPPHSAPSTPASLTVGGASIEDAHASALRGLIEGEVRTGRHDRMLYATDASIYQVEPIGVVVPAGVEDAGRALRYCFEHEIAVLPRGGGTSLAGQCVGRAVVVDLSAHCCGLDWVDAEARSCSVGPGITIDDLNDELRGRGHGLFFAPDPSTARQATIAGCIGNNAAGTRSVRYGRTSENVEAVRALLSTGEEVELFAGAAGETAGQAGRGTYARGIPDPAVVRRLTDGVIGVVRRHERLIRERFPKTLRRNAGYALDMVLADLDRAEREGAHPYETVNLANLLCGSEGTLAVTLGATLKLHPLPKARGLAVIGFPSLDEAIGAVVPLLALRPVAVELLDDMVIGLARENIKQRENLGLMPQPSGGRLEAVLYVEFFAEGDEGEVEAGFAGVREVVSRVCPAAGVNATRDAAAMGRALALRRAGEPLLHAIPGDRKPLGFVEDNAVPPERLGEFVRGFRAIVEREGTKAAFYAHASVGVLHVRPLLSLRSAADRAAMERIAVEVADLARSLGGVMSGEHGDGRARGPLLERHFGSELMGAFREVKAVFDPGGLLNPGNIVSPGGIASVHGGTRVAEAEVAQVADPRSGKARPDPVGVVGGDPARRAGPPKARRHSSESCATMGTYFDYSGEHGFDHAVELCNGAGVCRKKRGGTMCPSYMATLDERHSTRGRGNALRLAVSGQGVVGETKRRRDGETECGACGPVWGDPETLETLRLCLSCKACKSECPSNVDIAQYKAEYLAQSYDAAGKVPLQARVFARVRTINRVGSMFAPVSNWVARSAPNRWLMEKVIGVDRRRSLPGFERAAWRKINRRVNGPMVLLFGDCFSAFSEPGVALATARVFNAFGYRVWSAPAALGCCQRPAISTGQLAAATRGINRSLLRFNELLESPELSAMVVCEPSCLSAFKDEWAKLRLSQDAVAQGAALREGAGLDPGGAFLPEQFLAERWDEHPRRPAFHRPAGRVLLHGHCHQKALWGIESSAAMLRRVVPASQLHVLDTGCCGMAGSFGFTTDRYELSMKIGELGFLPAARSLEEGDTLVAAGTSCRHQALDGAGVRAVHPMEFLASLLKGE